MEQRVPQSLLPHNHTSIKQLSHRHNFEVSPLEKEDDQINAQSTLYNTYKNINNPQRWSPDREMLKQIRSFDVKSQNRMKVIADDYYNSAVFHKTTSFLEEIKGVIVGWQDKLRSKRKQVIEQTTTHIKKRWIQVEQHLLQLLSQWCLSCQKYEIASYLQRDQMKIDGALLQLLSQLGTKRQEIEIHLSKVGTLKKQEQNLYGEELTSHMKEVKNYYKHIWNREYEFQVESLEKECVSKLNKSYIYEGLEPTSVISLSEDFKREIDSLLSEYFKLNRIREVPSQIQSSQTYSFGRNSENEPKNASIQPQPQSIVKPTHRNPQPVEQNYSSAHSDMLAQRREQIYMQRLQRDKEWIRLVQSLNK